MNPFKLKINDTTKFLLPLMFASDTHTELFSDYFKQAYIGIMDDDTYDDTIILEYMETNDNHIVPSFKELKIQDNLCIYNIPEELIDDYEHFLNGQYSLLSNTSKQMILDFWNEDNDSMLYDILHKTQKGKETFAKLTSDKTTGASTVLKNIDLQQLELWPPPNVLQQELYYKASE